MPQLYIDYHINDLLTVYHYKKSMIFFKNDCNKIRAKELTSSILFLVLSGITYAFFHQVVKDHYGNLYLFSQIIFAFLCTFLVLIKLFLCFSVCSAENLHCPNASRLGKLEKLLSESESLAREQALIQNKF
jgi:uncharacterized membrane protein